MVELQSVGGSMSSGEPTNGATTGASHASRIWLNSDTSSDDLRRTSFAMACMSFASGAAA